MSLAKTIPFDNLVAPERSAKLAGLRVLLLTSAHDVADSRVYAREGRSLARMGASVTIVGSLHGAPPEDVTVVAVPSPRSRFDRFLLQPWRCLRRVWNDIFDIIHVHDAELLAILPAAKLRWPKARFIYDVHEDFANLMLVRDWLPRWLKPLVRAATNFVEKLLARLADGIVGVTPPLTAKFKHRRAVTAFNFVTSDFLQAATLHSRPPQKREFDLVHLGTLSRSRANFLCEVVSELHRRRPGTRSLIVGAPHAVVGSIRAQVPASCTVLGPTSYSDLPEMLANARVGIDVHPHLGEHLQVAIPVKVCEYMAAGCAVVTSSMPVLDSILLENAAPIDAITVLRSAAASDYVDAVMLQLEKIGLGDDPGDKLRSFATTRLDWEQQANRIADLYLKLLDRTCAHS